MAVKEKKGIFERLRNFRKKKTDDDLDDEGDVTTRQWKKIHLKYKTDVIYHRILSRSQRTRRPVVVEGAISGDPEVIAVLIERHTALDTPDEDGDTALHLAIRRGFWDVAHKLLDGHASVSLYNKEGISAIHLATVVNQRELVLRILKSGANANSADNTLTTPLMIAARTGALGLVYILLDYGAEVHLMDSERRTAVDFARLEGFQPIVDALLDYKPGKKFTIIPVVQDRVFKEAMRSLGIETKTTDVEPEGRIHEEKPKETLDEVEDSESFLSCNLDENGEDLKGFCGKVKSDIKKLFREVQDFQTKVAPRAAKRQRLSMSVAKKEATASHGKAAQVDDEVFVNINPHDADDKATSFCEKVKTDLKQLWRQVDRFEEEITRRHLANRPSTTVILHDKAVKGLDLLAKIEDIRNVVQEFKILVRVQDEDVTNKSNIN